MEHVFNAVDRDLNLRAVVDENAFLFSATASNGNRHLVCFELTKEFAYELRDFLNLALA